MSKVQNPSPAELVAKWWNLSQEVKRLAEEENTLRLQIAQLGFGYDPNQLQRGSQKIDFPGEESEFNLKIEFKVNENVASSEVNSVLAKLQKMGTPAEVIGELFSFTPKLRQTGYKMLSDKAKAVVDNIVTRSPGMPSVSKVEKKRKQGAEVRQAFAVSRGKK